MEDTCNLKECVFLYILFNIVNFNGMTNCLGLFYTWNLGNCVHYKFVYRFLCSCFLGFYLQL